MSYRNIEEHDHSAVVSDCQNFILQHAIIQNKSSSHRASNFLNRLCSSGLPGIVDFIGQRYQRFTVKQQFFQAH